MPDCPIFAADVLLPAILFSKNVLGGTTASHTCLVWGAVIFYVVQHRGIEPTEGFSDLVSGGSQGAVASGGGPLGSYLVVSRDLGGDIWAGAHFFYSSVNSRWLLLSPIFVPSRGGAQE